MKKLQYLSRKLRYKICEMSFRAKAAHLASSLSCIDMLISIYFGNIFKFNNSRTFSKDKFILSKGHAAAALYSVLAEKKIIPKSKLLLYGKNNSIYEEHPNFNIGGVDCSTGSLGHGLSFGIGTSISNNLLKKKGNIIVLMSDGECNEGSVWEAAGFATAQKLSNLVVLIDSNKWQATGRSKEIFGGDLKKKWEAFGWKTLSINGHNYFQILKSFTIAKESKRPCAIIANTVKGKGIKFMEDDNNWHYRVPNRDELKIIKKMLNI